MDMYLRLKYRTKSIEEIINKSKLGDDEHRYRKKNNKWIKLGG